MCTDLRLVRLKDMHISARTDFGYETQSRGINRGKWQATPTQTAAGTLQWTNDLGFLGMDASVRLRTATA
jgi:hypothetical protein